MGGIFLGGGKGVGGGDGGKWVRPQDPPLGSAAAGHLHLLRVHVFWLALFLQLYWSKYL